MRSFIALGTDESEARLIVRAEDDGFRFIIEEDDHGQVMWYGATIHADDAARLVAEIQRAIGGA